MMQAILTLTAAFISTVQGVPLLRPDLPSLLTTSGKKLAQLGQEWRGEERL